MSHSRAGRRIVSVALACLAGGGAATGPAAAQRAPADDELRSSPSLEALVDGDRHRVRLSNVLREASGLALDGSGGLWAHDDEVGAIYLIDPASGEVLDRRVLGPRPVAGDFEGLAWDGGRFHLVTSRGTLVSFAPGDERDVTVFTVRETAAAAWCEVEGLEYDPTRNTLLLACKEILQSELDGHALVLETDLPPGPTASAGRPLEVRVGILLTPDVLDDAGLPDDLPLSGIARHPVRRSWLLLSARARRLAEVTREGAVVAVARLSSSRHPQAEGVAITADGGTLLLADEGGGGRGRLTSYAASGGGS